MASVEQEEGRRPGAAAALVEGTREKGKAGKEERKKEKKKERKKEERKRKEEKEGFFFLGRQTPRGHAKIIKHPLTSGDINAAWARQDLTS